MGIVAAISTLVAAGGQGCGSEPAPVSVEGVRWGYEGDAGPDHWSALDPSYSLCSVGKDQSPIDIAAVVDAKPSELSFEYGRVRPTLVNHGVVVQADLAGDSAIHVGMARYAVDQLDFHLPSEHTIEGESFPMEIHVVHSSPDGWIAVVALLVREGRENAALAALGSRLPTEVGASTIPPAGSFDLDRLLPAHRFYYHYAGSLTTPPCSQAVRWYVLMNPIEASSRQLSALGAVVSGNRRPQQELNDRRIELGAPL